MNDIEIKTKSKLPTLAEINRLPGELDVIAEAMDSELMDVHSAQDVRDEPEAWSGVHAGTREFFQEVAQLDAVDSGYVSELQQCDNAESILLLIRKFCEHAIGAIRFYHLDKDCDDLRFVSVACEGHEEDVAEKFRIGKIVKYKSSSTLRDSDSFWCQELKVPIVFISVKGTLGRFGLQKKSLQANILKFGIPIILTPPSPLCEKVLAGHKSDSWIDMPLMIGTTCVGKLSCDINVGLSRIERSVDLVFDLWKLASTAASRLDFFYHQNHVYPLADILIDINACASEEDLLDYCTSRMQKHFNCKYSSVFLLSEDTFGSKKLILQKTSFPKRKQDEGRVFYDLNETSMTSWVARNQKTIRVHDLDGDGLEQQLAAYRGFGDRLRWKRDFLTDSDNHDSFLAVPLASDGGEVLGVIRMTQKRVKGDSVPHFTERDQILLEKIVKTAIVPRLLTIRNEDFGHRFSLETLRTTEAISVVDVGPANTLAAADDFGKLLRKICPERGVQKKLYLFNMLCNDGTSFCHHPIGGRLLPDMVEDKFYNLDGSLTSYVLSNPAEVVFVNDLENAHRCGAMHMLCRTANTALACPVAFRDRQYGVFVVKSDHFDLCPQTDGRLIELLAASAGAVFARHEILELKQLLDRPYWQNRLDGDVAKPINRYIKNVLEWFGDPDKGSKSIPSSDTVEIKTLAQMIADSPNRDRVFNFADPVVVQGNRSVLLAILMSCADTMCRQSQRSIEIHGFSSGRWLTLGVGENGIGDAIHDLKLETTTVPAARQRSPAFRAARTLTHWCQAPDGARGSLQFLKGNKGIVATIPIQRLNMTDSQL